LKNYDRVSSPNSIVMAFTDEFENKTSQGHELWQADFMYLKVIDRGWYYLSTVLPLTM